MNCIKNLLEGFGHTKKLEPNVKDSLTLKCRHALLHSFKMNTNVEIYISLAWNTVEYWIEK
jgi:hypothetical protein